MGFYSEKIFPYLCDRSMKMKILDPYRSDVLKTVRGNILEIGFGTGANLRYYPPAIQKITVLEPNRGMNKYAQEALQKRKMAIEKVEGKAESMPFEPETLDTVVSTLTLCSVGEPVSALREIHRVLKPGGIFLFFEHGLANHSGIVKWQNRLNGINKALADGCNINRDMKTLIEQAGFKFDALDNFYLPKGPRTHGYIYKGVATK